MEPRTLRNIGTACLAFGVAGLAFTFIIVGLVVTGTTESPGLSVVVIGIQSVVNVAAGWNLRRWTASSAD